MRAPDSAPLSHPACKETGIVLLLCLLFLTSLMLLGFSASAETVVQSMLTNNLQHREQVRQSTLEAQRWVESWLLGLDGAEPAACQRPCTGLLLHVTGTLPEQPETEDLSWWMNNGQVAGFDPLSGEQIAIFSAGGVAPPVWLIERVHKVATGPDEAGINQAWYRILVRGSGRTGTTVSVIESIVSRPWRTDELTGDSGGEPSGNCPGFDPIVPCRRVAWRTLR